MMGVGEFVYARNASTSIRSPRVHAQTEEGTGGAVVIASAYCCAREKRVDRWNTESGWSRNDM